MKYIASRRYGGTQDNICLEWKNLVLLSQKNLGVPSGLLRRQNKSIGECKSTSAMVGCHNLYIWYPQNVVINISYYGIRLGVDEKYVNDTFKCILITRFRASDAFIQTSNNIKTQILETAIQNRMCKWDRYQTFTERFISNLFRKDQQSVR